MNEAELLFSRVLNCDRVSLYLNKKDKLGAQSGALVSSVLRKRISGYPLQYILGKADFFGREFLVNESVLIPRPETEILVETALKIGLRLKAKGLRPDMLELGTGSGCVAISLAKELPGANVIATDISEKALGVARKNGRLHNVKINFVQGNLFNTHPLPFTPYHLIISNPPYIPSGEINKLQPEIAYEPRQALDGGKDGLDYYRRIAGQCSAYLKEEGVLVFEIGFGQYEEIEKILQKGAKLQIIDVIRDYADIRRVIVAQKVK